MKSLAGSGNSRGPTLTAVAGPETQPKPEQRKLWHVTLTRARRSLAQWAGHGHQIQVSLLPVTVPMIIILRAARLPRRCARGACRCSLPGTGWQPRCHCQWAAVSHSVTLRSTASDLEEESDFQTCSSAPLSQTVFGLLAAAKQPRL